MKPHERKVFIVMTGIWGATTVQIILGIPFYILDSLFGTGLVGFLDNNILSGGEIALFKVCKLCGLPASLLTDYQKKLKNFYEIVVLGLFLFGCSNSEPDKMKMIETCADNEYQNETGVEPTDLLTIKEKINEDSDYEDWFVI